MGSSAPGSLILLLIQSIPNRFMQVLNPYP
jgi:hypothetical protein